MSNKMNNKYKLIKDLPDVKAGTIFQYNEGFTSEYYEYIENNQSKKYSIDIVENNPDWFVPYLFTTEDDVDIYNGDEYVILVTKDYENKKHKKGDIFYSQTLILGEEGIPLNFEYNIQQNIWKIFSTKEAAEQYLESLKPKFKIGAIVKFSDENSNYNNAVFEVLDILDETDGDPDNITESYDYLIPDKNNILSLPSLFRADCCKLATDKEKQLCKKYQLGDIVVWKRIGSIGKIIEIRNREVVVDNPSGQDIEFNDIRLATDQEKDRYLNVIRSRFEVGDIVKLVSQSHKTTIDIVKIIAEIENDWVIEYSNKEKDQIGKCWNTIVKPTNDEIIKYYEKQGWVKGVKFKDDFDNQIHTVDSINLFCGKVIVHDQESEHYYSGIENCELIKEPTYPKSWKELNTVSHKMEDYNNCEDFLSSQDIFNFGYYINEGAVIRSSGQRPTLKDVDKNIFRTKSQAESALAFAQLSQLHKAMIDEYNRVNNYDWKPNWDDIVNRCYTVRRLKNKLHVFTIGYDFSHLSFPEKSIAEFSLLHHNDLWKQYYELE